MKKESQFTAAWPTAYNLIREMGLMKQLPPMNKIKLDQSAPDNPGAFGFVTTEDSDNNGTLDTMHIVVPNIDRHLQGINASELQKLKIENPERLKQILMPIVELIAHEQGHQQDYRHGEDNPFPGGEQVADQAAQQALNQISTQATNNTNKNDIKRSFVMKKEIISRLVKLAGDLDEKKAFDLSDEVTAMAEKFAQEGIAGADFGSGKFTEMYSKNQEASPGKIQIPGDPYSYNVHPDGGYYVAKAPEQRYDLFGHRIKPGDPGYGKIRGRALELGIQGQEKPTQQPSAAPAPGGYDDSLNLGSPSDEEKMAMLDAGIRRESEKLEAIDGNVSKLLGRMGFRGQSLDTVYQRGVNPAQKIQALERGIDFLQKENMDTAELEGQLAKLRNVSEGYTELLRERRELRGNPAEDQESAAMDLQPQSADDGEEEKVEAGLGPDELVKNASVNAVFWKPNVKTPFGR